MKKILPSKINDIVGWFFFCACILAIIVSNNYEYQMTLLIFSKLNFMHATILRQGGQ